MDTHKQLSNEATSPASGKATSRRHKRTRAERLLAGDLKPPPLQIEPAALLAERAAARRLALLYRGVQERFVSLDLRQMMNDPIMPEGYRREAAALMTFPEQRGIRVLSGPRGVGKTALASALAKLVTERGGFAWAVNTSTYLDRIDTLRGDARERYRDRYIRADLVVFDELQERRTDGWRAYLETEFVTVIDARYGNRRPTLLITNLLPEAIVANVGDSIARRVLETGGIVPCNWDRIDELLKTAASLAGA